MRFSLSTFLFIAVSLLSPSCSNENLAARYPQIPSYAISQTEKTHLGSLIRPEYRQHKGMSGFHVMPTGKESFSARLVLIRAAEKTIDLQYYSINDDTTSNLLLEALVKAAQRGVRVRFLLDSIDFDEVKKTFAVLGGLKNMEVRIFNPFHTRDEGLLETVLKEVTDLDEMNHRMHNKVMIVDNQVSVIGGRNLGDEYFEEHSDVTFRDLDMLCGGPIVAAMSRSFDQYWNDQNSQPLGRLIKPQHGTKEAKEILTHLSAHWDLVSQTEKGRTLLKFNIKQYLKKDGLMFDWAKAEFAADSPRKIRRPVDDTHSRPMRRLEELTAHAHKEFIIVSPYFVPQEEGVEWLSNLVKRGVTVKVLTNSLASTDMIAAYTGYRRYRRPLIEHGIELYELQPIGGKRPPQRLIGRKAPARAMLHAKLYVVDRKDVMVGSFNLDPRSIGINTELALVIHSKTVASQVAKMFDQTIDPSTSYRLTEKQDDGIIWQAKNKTYESDPHAGTWRGIEAFLMSLLPIEDQL